VRCGYVYIEAVAAIHRVGCRVLQCVAVCCRCGYVYICREKEVSLQEIRSEFKGFEFVPGLCGMVLRGGYLYGAWPRTVRILIEFKFIVPELRQLVVFCTCRILPEGLKFVENVPLWEALAAINRVSCRNIHTEAVAAICKVSCSDIYTQLQVCIQLQGGEDP